MTNQNKSAARTKKVLHYIGPEKLADCTVEDYIAAVIIFLALNDLYYILHNMSMNKKKLQLYKFFWSCPVIDLKEDNLWY